MYSELDISTAFAEELRLRIALLLHNSVLCVKCLKNVLKSPQPTVSRHLSLLRKAGIVDFKRNGMHSYYKLDFQGEFGQLKKKLITAYCGTLADREPYKSDRKHLTEQSQVCNADCKVGT